MDTRFFLALEALSGLSFEDSRGMSAGLQMGDVFLPLILTSMFLLTTL